MKIEKAVVGKFAVNCYMIIDETTKEAAIIDPGDQVNVIERMLVNNEAKLKYIILTHGHGDHIGAVLPLKEKFNASIIASEDERDMLTNANNNESSRICDYPIEFDADHYVRDNETLQVGEVILRFIKTPGHTMGGMCILADHHLFTGDTLFQRSVGRTDLYGGNHQTLISSIAFKLLLLDDETIVYPGHGPKSTIGYERQNNPFI